MDESPRNRGDQERASIPPSPTSPASDSSSSMAPRRNRPVTPKRDADLSALLTEAHKTQLVALVTTIMDAMEAQIVRNFGSELPAAADTASSGKSVASSEKSAKHRSWHLPFADFDLAKRSSNPKGKGVQTAPDPTAEGMLGKKKVVANPSQAELMKDALAAFAKWQAAVLKRMENIVAARESGPMQNQASSGRSYSRPGNNKQAHRSQGVPSKNSAMGRKSTKEAPREVKPSVAEADATFRRLYPPTPTPLRSLPAEKNALLLHSMLLLVLSLESYAAYSRVLVLNMASSLSIPLHVLAEDEVRAAKGLSRLINASPKDELAPKKPEEPKPVRRWKGGAATTTATGGLAAPLVAAGIGSVPGGTGLGNAATAGLLGAMADNAHTVGTLFGLFGARGAGKMTDSYPKEIPDFGFLSLRATLKTEIHEAKEVPPDDRRLKFVIGISGWLTETNDTTSPWRVLGPQSEVYGLRWELDTLAKMAAAFETVLRSASWSLAKRELVVRNVVASLVGATWPASLVKLSKIVDTPWMTGIVRADKTGVTLADAIINKVQGERGVTLVGYSLGARVIYSCLMALSERRGFGLVENVVMMGTPAPSDEYAWSAMRSVVTGRVVNVYSQNDYMLAFLYRTCSFGFGVAGLQPVEGAPAVENVNATNLVDCHLRYQYLAGTILKHLGWEDIDLDQATKSAQDLVLVEDRLAQYERKRRGTATEPVVAKKAPQPKVDVGARKEQRELAKEMAAVKISARRVPK